MAEVPASRDPAHQAPLPRHRNVLPACIHVPGPVVIAAPVTTPPLPPLVPCRDDDASTIGGVGRPGSGDSG